MILNYNNLEIDHKFDCYVGMICNLYNSMQTLTTPCEQNTSLHFEVWVWEHFLLTVLYILMLVFMVAL